MFDQVKTDPSKQEENKDDEDIVISDYFKYEKGAVLKTEAYYVTKIA
jgi:hypothetical protein